MRGAQLGPAPRSGSRELHLDTSLLIHTPTRLHPAQHPDPSLARRPGIPSPVYRSSLRCRCLACAGSVCPAIVSCSHSHVFRLFFVFLSWSCLPDPDRPLPEPHRTLVEAAQPCERDHRPSQPSQPSQPSHPQRQMHSVAKREHMISCYACWRTPRRRPRDKLEFVSRSRRSCFCFCS
jgi:hypothetical protein